jgi:hypothetical protein
MTESEFPQFKKRKKMTAVKLKPKKIRTVTLKERAIALIEELREAPSEEAVEALIAISQELDDALDVLAEERREKREGWAIPAGSLRNQWNAQGRRLASECLCRSYQAAIKTN